MFFCRLLNEPGSSGSKIRGQSGDTSGGVRGHSSGGQDGAEGVAENTKGPRRCLWAYEGSGDGDGLEMDEDFGELSDHVAPDPGASGVQRGGVAQPNPSHTNGRNGGLSQRGIYGSQSVEDVDSEPSGGGRVRVTPGGSAQQEGLVVCGDPGASRRTGQWVEKHASASTSTSGVEDLPLEDGYGLSSNERSGLEGSSPGSFRTRVTRRDTTTTTTNEGASGRDSGALVTPTKVRLRGDRVRGVEKNMWRVCVKVEGSLVVGWGVGGHVVCVTAL